MNKLKVEVKINKEQLENYQSLLSNLIASGYDIILMEKQREIWIYLPEESGFNLILTVDGKWRLE